MCAWVLALGFVVGALIVLPGWSAELAARSSGTIVTVAVLTVGLQTTTAYFASVGHGYIPPLAWAAFTIFLAQILSVLGWGAGFPWAVPALLSGVAGPEGETVTLAGFIAVAAASAVGFAATVLWWERADHAG
jgi:ABC-2 type transport system permease protein